MVAAMFVLMQTHLLRFVVHKQPNRAGGALHATDGRSKYKAAVEPVQQWFLLIVQMSHAVSVSQRTSSPLSINKSRERSLQPAGDIPHLLSFYFFA